MSETLTAVVCLLVIFSGALLGFALALIDEDRQHRANEDGGTVTWPGPEPRRRYTK